MEGETPVLTTTTSFSSPPLLSRLSEMTVARGLRAKAGPAGRSFCTTSRRQDIRPRPELLRREKRMGIRNCTEGEGACRFGHLSPRVASPLDCVDLCLLDHGGSGGGRITAITISLSN